MASESTISELKIIFHEWVLFMFESYHPVYEYSRNERINIEAKTTTYIVNIKM